MRSKVKAFIVFFSIACMTSSPGTLYGKTYTESAHGDKSNGVSRVNGYATGNCAHCHEMHATLDEVTSPYPYTLFYSNYIEQTDLICYNCHGYGRVKNRSYSFRAGGWTGDTVDDLMESFNQTSSHNLGDILNFIKDQDWGFNEHSTPCVACHNPHYAQGDPFNSPNVPKSSATRGWPLSRPSEHGSIAEKDRLWGDDTGERMKDYAASLTYQAPYRYGSTSAYEPDGSTTTDGSNLTDMVTFCLDCHSSSSIYSTSLGRNLRAIDWGVNGDKHGKRGRNRTYRGENPIFTPPYSVSIPNYVLSCTDCHEPHGSPSYQFLIRKEVNGGITAVTADTDRAWKTLCLRCHYRIHTGKSCISCHYHGGTF